MTTQMAEEGTTPARNTWSRFLTRLKDPAEATVAVGTILVAIGAGVLIASEWLVNSEVDKLRVEITKDIGDRTTEIEVLRGRIAAIEDRSKTTDERSNSATKENATRITTNGERIARIEGALDGTTDRVKELDATVKRNAERVTALEVVGTPH